MKKFFGAISAFLLLAVMASCNDDSPFPGFKKMENGAYMKFYNKNNSALMPRLKDEVTIEMAQYFNDSLLFTTVGEKPMTIVLTEAEFEGDVVDGLLMMHVGDSARLAMSADSVFTVMLQMNEIPEEYAGKPIYYDLKLLSVKPFETLEAERRALLDSLKSAEEAFLAPFRDDPNNTITESGIIILENTGKGKTAKMGEYVNFDFVMCSPTGDTVMSFLGDEPVEMQYGEEFIGEGFNEAIGMVPEGGTMRLVIPSALAFDSVGYEPFIMPYTPMVVQMKMNSVMDKAAFDKLQAAKAAEKEAEKKRLMALESKNIAEYIKAKGITVAPTESGLYIIPQEEGEGDVAKWGDEVTIHFIIKNIKDEQLESTYDYGQPVPFKVGAGEMIPAVEEAVMTMQKGDKVTLVVPSALAFADYDLGDLLPPYSPLVIDLELVEVRQ
jgi:FKBP-type peptidyl-prolyl cis-trans isomerase